MSGTRSNPSHNPAYEAGYVQDGYAQDGYYAVNELSGVQPGLAAPYAGSDGASEAAEYYYEDQYDQQLAQYRSGGYDEYGPYTQPSTGYDPQAGYPSQEYEGPRGSEHPEYGRYPGEYPDYQASYSADGPDYPPESYESYESYESNESYEADGYGPEYAPSHRARHGAASATAVATDLLTVEPATETLLEPATRPEAPVKPVGMPASRRARPAERPASTEPDAKRPPVLRTRPRIGPLGRIVQGTVLAALVAGATAYVSLDKTITLSVDGRDQTVHTFAGTVGAVLAADGVDLGSRDIVSPAPSASAAGGQIITVRYGRPLNLSVDGVARQTWVHYPTLAGALQELGVRTTGARISQPTTTVIPRSGLNGVVVFTMRRVTFLVDGRSVPIETTAATVAAAMQQAGIVLHDQDTPSVPVGSVPTDNQTISINRVSGSTETRQVSIPYMTTQVDDPNAYTGTTSVKTQGVDGEKTITYSLLTVNGVKQSPKLISETVTRQPVDEVVSVGTKSLPTSASSLNWTALATCESGDNPSEDTGNGFYGMYQFTISTWDSLGGTGLPSNASAATQTALAEKLYEEAGAGQWPVCGKNLFG